MKKNSFIRLIDETKVFMQKKTKMQKKLEKYSKFQKYLDRVLEVAEEVTTDYSIFIHTGKVCPTPDMVKKWNCPIIQFIYTKNFYFMIGLLSTIKTPSS